jgi:tetratricopeptide (TPR) repeat protein
MTTALAQKSSVGTVRGLMVGIDTYDDQKTLPNLMGAAQDAIHLAQTLAEVTKSDPKNFIVLTTNGGIPVPRSSIIRELEHLAHLSGPRDKVFLLFAGHGIDLPSRNGPGGDANHSQTEPWFCTTDAVLSDEELSRDTCLDVRKINELASKIPNQVLVVSYDMCRVKPLFSAGQFMAARGPQKETPPPSIQLPAREAEPATQYSSIQPIEPTGQMTLFACGPGQRSHEWESKKRGVFTYFFEEGLQKAADADGVLRLGPVVEYLQTAVSEAVGEIYNGQEEQTPFPTADPEQVNSVVLATGRPPGSGGAFHPKPTDSASEAVHAYLLAGTELFNKKEYKTAAELFQKALDSSQHRSALAAFWTGRCYDYLELYSKSGPLFEEAARLDPTLGLPHNNLGLRFLNQGEPVKALHEYEECVRLTPGWVPALLNLGDYYREQAKDLDRAKGWYENALSLDATYVLARINLGQLYLVDLPGHPKNLAKALEEFSIAKVTDPSDPESYLKTAQVLQLVGKSRDAEKELLKGTSSSQSGELYVALGDLYGQIASLNKSDLAQEMYAKAAETEPSPSVLADVSWAFKLIGNYDLCQKYARQGLEIEDTQALENSLGCNEWENGTSQDHLAKAEVLLIKANSLWPHASFVSRNLGSLFVQNRHFDRAVEAFRDVLKSPEHEPTDFGLLAGVLLDDLNKPSDALEVFRLGFSAGYQDSDFLAKYASIVCKGPDWKEFDMVSDAFKSKNEGNVEESRSFSPALKLNAYQHEISRDPHDRNLYSGLVDLLTNNSSKTESSKLEESMRVWRSAEMANPGSAWPAVEECAELVSHKDWQKAKFYLDQAIRLPLTVSDEHDLDSSAQCIYNALYPAKVKGAVSKDAAKHLLSVLELLERNCSQFDLFEGRALYERSLGDRVNEEKALVAATRQMKYADYLSWDVYYRLANLALARNDRSYIDRLDSGWAALGHERGALWLSLYELNRTSNHSEAMRDIERALHSNPKLESAYIEFIGDMALSGDLKRVESLCFRAVTSGIDVTSWRSEAARYLDWENPRLRSVSERLFAKQFDLFPNFFDAHLYYGLKLESVKDYPRAEREFQQARNSDNDLAATICLARVFAIQSKFGSAGPLFRKAARNSKVKMVSCYSAAILASYLLDSRNDFVGAEAAMEQLLASCPDSGGAGTTEAMSLKRYVTPELKRWMSLSHRPQFRIIEPCLLKLSHTLFLEGYRASPVPLWEIPLVNELLRENEG